MQWTHHLLTADGYEPLPTADLPPSSSTRATPPTDPRLLQFNRQVLTVQPASLRAIDDIWAALKLGKRPGPDPRACDGHGRTTTEAWLTGRFAEMSTIQKYALLKAAVCQYPLCLAGLTTVLQLVSEWGFDLDKYNTDT